jgi:hypothetical protein
MIHFLHLQEIEREGRPSIMLGMNGTINIPAETAMAAGVEEGKEQEK